LKYRDRLEDLGVDGSIILEGILEKQDGMVWTGQERVADFLK